MHLTVASILDQEITPVTVKYWSQITGAVVFGLDAVHLNSLSELRSKINLKYFWEE